MLNGWRTSLAAHGRTGLRFIGPGVDQAFDVEVGNRPEDPVEFTVAAMVGGDGSDVLSIAADAGTRVYTVAKEDFVDSGRQWTPGEGWRVEEDGKPTWWVKASGVGEAMDGLLFRIETMRKK